MRVTGSYARSAEPRRDHLVPVSVVHVPAGIAVYEGGAWRATFASKDAADGFAGDLARKPWRIRA